MIVDRGQQQVAGFQPQSQLHPHRHTNRRPLNASGENSELEEEEEEDDGENDEENIVIDLADEDEDDEEDDTDVHRDFESLNPYGGISFYTTNNNNNNHLYHQSLKGSQLESSSEQQAFNEESQTMRFSAGDLVWFDPNLLGYSIPGKVLDFYPDLGVLRVEGCAQPVPELSDLARYERQLAEAEQELQVYELNERQQFFTVKPRLPISDESGIKDLIDMEELSTESIIWNLKLRHKQELVYTSCGRRILISMNPFKQLSELYNLEQVNKYDTLDTTKLSSLTTLNATNPETINLLKWLLLTGEKNTQKEQSQDPHIFALANKALLELLIDGQDQCFVLLGESGSGKTEACKLLVQYLATVNKSPSNLMTEQILESIQVLESFGNAKSQLNDNSSRFGRLLSISFDLSNGFIAHAGTTDLNLLDRGRIVSQMDGERNYHIFYELLAGLSRSEKEKYGLQNADKYFYLNQGHCIELTYKEDGADFRALLASMQVLGFNYEEQDTIFRILASILHLGNVYFHRKLLALRSGPLVGQQQAANVEGVEVGSDTEVRWVSHLLQIQFDAVLRCLTVRSTPSSTCDSLTGQATDYVLSPLNIDQALDTRDAIARALYTYLFRWLVQRINAMINQQVTNGVAASTGTAASDAGGSFSSSANGPHLCRTGESLCEFQPDRLVVGNPSPRGPDLSAQRSLATISILDAFGFENLAENGFEQLCINYAAELLHYQTVRYLLRLEQAEYARERLAWKPVIPAGSSGQYESTSSASSAFQWNGNSCGHPGAVVSLLARKPLGILALLDDESNFPKASDASFVEKCHHNHTMNDNYQRSRAANQHEFGIRHFRQQSRLVWYQADGFIEKNRDCLRSDIVDLLLGSRISIINDMLRKIQPSGQTLRHSGGMMDSSRGKTLSRTHDGRLVSMKPRAGTVATRFQDALASSPILDALNSTTGSSSLPWFVICLRSSRWLSPSPFEVSYVEEQARSINLLELAQVRRAGYPIRFRFFQFIRRYRCLLKQSSDSDSHETAVISYPRDLSYSHQASGSKKRALRDLCAQILGSYPKGHQCGLTKVFLNERLYTELENKRRNAYSSAILLLQRQVRGWIARRNYLYARHSVVLLQAQVRGFIARKHFWRDYSLIVGLQRRWRRCLTIKRKKALEARRRAQRQQHQYQLLELQAAQRRQADQLRHRAISGHPSQQRNMRVGVKLRIPHQLAQLYRIQRHWVPVHELAHLSELSLRDMTRNEQVRLESTTNDDKLSVPLMACDALRGHSLPDKRETLELLNELEYEDRYSLANFLRVYFSLESPAFGYSRVPILRPFSWPQLQRRLKSHLRRSSASRQELILNRFRAAEDQALMLYELVLRYIDSEPLDDPNQPTTTERLLKFKLLADYLIQICLAEPLLRDELFLQLVSQSWQNPRARSAENTWQLMSLSLTCLQPLDRHLTRHLLRFVCENCTQFANYRRILIIQLSSLIIARSPADRQVRRFPPSLAEYWACELALCKFALATSCYMDDRALTGPPPDTTDVDPDEFARQLRSNQGGRTMALLGSRTSAEELAASVLKARLIPLANLTGWSLEIQFEGAQSELSCRLRGDQKPFDQLARVELLPELVNLIEMRKRRQTHLPQKHKQRHGSETCNYHEQQQVANKKKLHRRSASMQDLQLASWSALNGRYFKHAANNSLALHYASPTSPQNYYNSNCQQQMVYGQRSHQQHQQRRGSLQQLHQQQGQLYHQQGYGYHRRSQTPNATLLSQHRLSTSSAYGSDTRRSSSAAYVTSPSDCWPPAPNCESCPGYAAPAYGLTHQQRPSRMTEFSGDGNLPYFVSGTKKRTARRSASSSSRSRQHQQQQVSDYYSGSQQTASIVSSGVKHSAMNLQSRPKNPQVERHRATAQHQPPQELRAQQQMAAPATPSVQAPQAPLDSGYYVASSVLSDTSEAASLASHVRGIKIPAHNDDLDQYLDDLFNPVLDEELSDARSLAASLRISSAALMNPAAQNTQVQQITSNKSNNNNDAYAEPKQVNQSGNNLSPTFESLLESLSSGGEQKQQTTTARLIDTILAPPPPPPPLPPSFTVMNHKQSEGVENLSSSGEQEEIGNEATLTEQLDSCEQSKDLLGSVGKLKISSEMKAKLEQLTVGRDDSSTPKSQKQKVAEQRKQLLESQLSNGNSKRDSGVVMAAKQQLAAAAGLALNELDASGGKRKSSDLTNDSDLAHPDQARRSRAILDQELGPQTRAAISQRQAFYQLSASSDRLNQLDYRDDCCLEKPNQANQLQSSSEHNFFPPPPPCALSSDNLTEEGVATRPATLTRAMQMCSNLNEAGQSSELGKESERIYQGTAQLAKSMLQRQQERLRNEPHPLDNQWVVSSPDPTLEKRQRGQHRVGGAQKKLHQFSSQHQQATSKKSRFMNEVGAYQSGWADMCYELNQEEEEPKEEQFCLAYTSVDWQVKIRKEFFKPSETYEDALVVQLIFVQLVADVFNPRHWTRLNNKERAAMKALMKDNSIGYAPSLPQIGQLQEVKHELVRMARSFGLYFTRSYAATNYALTDKVNNYYDANEDGQSIFSSSSSLFSSSDDDDDENNTSQGEKRNENQAEKLALRLRNANNLGLEWLDMVAVHHSGLRLVALENPAARVGSRVANMGVSGGDQLQPGASVSSSAQTLAYRVLETLKYRDMTDVSQVGHRELLVSMRNGKKCWLISSDQAAQLTSLLRSFHTDYNDQLSSAAAKDPSTLSNHIAAAKKSSKQQKKQQQHHHHQQPHKDALLASDDDHHGDHIKQRQTSNSISRLYKTSNSHYDLVNGERILSDNLATLDKANLKQHQHKQREPIKHQHPPSSSAASPSSSSAANGGCEQNSSTTSEPLDLANSQDKKKKKQQHQEVLNNKSKKPSSTLSRGKQSLWQNSLSRMSTKLALFANQSTTSNNDHVTSKSSKKQHQVKYDHQEGRPSFALAQQLALDAWIETKVDFEDDDEPESTESINQLCAESEKKPENSQDEPQSQQHPIATSQNGSMRSRKSERVAQDADGRHSMLQFALYNFREAINKYSLESRAHKAQVGAGDTSTLRGSLKLIETLRGTRSSRNGSEQTGNLQQQKDQQQQQQQPLIRDKQAQPDEWTWRELAEMVKFTPNPLKHPLLRLSSEDLERKALESFRAIMQYMGDAPDLKQPAQTQEVECVYLILMNCHNFPQLRDEIYCQLMKQTTNNRSANPDSCLRGWRLFSIVAAYFDCSSHFKPYLLKYLETAAYDKRRAYCSVASLCLQNLRKTFKYGGRRNVPSIEEIAATSAGRNSKRQIYRLPGGTERVINTKSTTVVDDIIHEICSNMLGVTDSDEMLEFSLYCIADGDLYTMPLNRDEYILDITTELIKNHQQYFLIFCRSIWHYPLRLDSKLYIEVIFNQIAPDYLEGLLLVLPGLPSAHNHQHHHRAFHNQINKSAHPLRLKTKTVKEIARIAALLHRASGTDYMPHKDEVKYLLPKPIVSALKHYQRSLTSNSAASSSGSSSGSSLARTHQHSSAVTTTSTDTFQHQQQLHEDENDLLLNNNSQHETLLITTPQKWVELVQNNWREMSAFDTLDAKAQFLDIVRHWPLFGSSFFAIKFIQRDLIQPMNFILALNKLGIQMLDMNTHETIHKYPFNDVISTRKVRSEDGALFLDLKCGNLMKRTIIRIQTDQAHEISRLIRQYIDIELLQQKQQQQPHQSNQTVADISSSSQIVLNNESLADK